MVRHFEGESGTEESIGRNTGLLVSIRPLAVPSLHFFYFYLDNIRQKHKLQLLSWDLP